MNEGRSVQPHPPPGSQSVPAPPPAQSPSANATKPDHKPDWKVGASALEQITGYTGQAIVHGNALYFSQNYALYSYHEDRDKWEELPRCENKEFAVTVVDNRLTTIGGVDRRDLHSDAVFSLRYRQWERILPAMPTARAHPAALTTPTHLLVAGGTYVAENPGRSHVGYDVVELMNLDTKHWSAATKLPEAIRYPQLMHANDGNVMLYDTEKNSVYGCSLEMLLQPAGGAVWAKKEPIRFIKEGASLAKAGDSLLAIGGRDEAGDPCREIYCYDALEDGWSRVTDMRTPRYWVLSAVAPSNVLVVVGGFKGQGEQACELTETRVVDFL